MANQHGDIKQDELGKLFHLRDDLHGRAVPLHAVYDPDYDGKYVPDWADDPDWFMWIVQDGELHALDGFPAEGAYFGKEAASEKDVYFPFIHFYTQHASWPDLLGIMSDIEDDIRNLAICMSKIALYQHLANNSGLATRRFVISEIEYIFSVCRSIYDRLQFIAMKSWEKVQLKEGGKNQMPSEFSDIALHGNAPVDADSLVEKYGLSDTLAKFYQQEAEEFIKIREFRDDVLHHGETIDLVFTVDEGYAVQSHIKPFANFDVWDENTFLENDLAPLWPPLAYVIHHTLTAMNRFQDALTTEIAFPPEIAPDYVVYMRGEYLHNLGYLESLIEENVWGKPLLNEIKKSLETSTSDWLPG